MGLEVLVQSLSAVLDALSVPTFLATIVIVGFFLYILFYSILQVRQLKVLKNRIVTDADGMFSIIAYIYLAIQFLIFVVTLLIL